MFFLCVCCISLLAASSIFSPVPLAPGFRVVLVGFSLGTVRVNHIVWKPEVQNWPVVSENLPSIISRYACGLVLFDVALWEWMKYLARGWS